MLRLSLLFTLITMSSNAASLPSWMLGRWNGDGILMQEQFSTFGPDRAESLLKAAKRLSISLTPQAITAVPATIFGFIEGDGLAVTVKHDVFGSLYMPDGRYVTLGPPVSIEQDTILTYVTVRMRRCVFNRASGNAVSRDGHSVPPVFSENCEPVRIYSLPDGRIGWETDLGWLLLSRPAAPVSAP